MKNEQFSEYVKKPVTTLILNQAEQALSDAKLKLLQDEPFYGYITYRLETKYSTNLDTLGVHFDGLSFVLTINPNFFLLGTVADRKIWLKHEVMHLIQQHPFRGPSKISSLKESAEQMLRNIAADLAINQYIPELKDDSTLGNFTFENITFNKFKKTFPNLQPEQTMEYYYELLKLANKKQLEMIEKLEQEGFSDSHEKWDQKEGVTKTIGEQLLRSIVNNAKVRHKEAQNMGKQMGDLPLGVERLIMKLNEAKLNWKSLLRHFVANSEEVIVEQNRRRPNRRTGWDFPGNKYHTLLNIGVIMDLSGSIGEDIANQFLGEIDSISKNGAVITVCQVDCTVHSVEKYNPKKKMIFEGGGGTDMNPGVQEMLKIKPDIMICFTDGYIPPMTVKAKQPFLWVVVDNKEFKEKYGKVLHIDSTVKD